MKIWLNGHRKDLTVSMFQHDDMKTTESLKDSLIVAIKQAYEVTAKSDFLIGAVEYEELELEIYKLNATISNINTELINERNRQYTKLSDIEKKINVYTRPDSVSFSSEQDRQWATLVGLARQYCLVSQPPTREKLRVKWQLVRTTLTSLTPYESDPWMEPPAPLEATENIENDEFASNEKISFAYQVFPSNEKRLFSNLFRYSLSNVNVWNV